MTHFETNSQNKCLDCGHQLSLGSDAFGDAEPHPGDFSVCIACGSLCVFQADMSLRRPTEAELGELPAEMQTRIATVQGVTRMFARTFARN